MNSLATSKWTMNRIIACFCPSTLTLAFVVVNNQTSSKASAPYFIEHMHQNQIRLARRSSFFSLVIYGNRLISHLFSLSSGRKSKKKLAFDDCRGVTTTRAVSRHMNNSFVCLLLYRKLIMIMQMALCTGCSTISSLHMYTCISSFEEETKRRGLICGLLHSYISLSVCVSFCIQRRGKRTNQ